MIVLVRAGEGIQYRDAAQIEGGGVGGEVAVLLSLQREAGDDIALSWDGFAVPNVESFELSTEVDGQPDSSPSIIPNTISSLQLWNVAPGHTYRFVLQAMRTNRRGTGPLPWTTSSWDSGNTKFSWLA